MKRKLFLTAIILFTGWFTAFAQIRSNRDLLGKWKGADMQIEFFSDAKLMMIVPGGRLPIAGYQADFMHNPINLVITISDNGSKLVYKGTIKFIDNETILLQYFGNDRDNDAFAKGKIVTLKKSR